MMRSGRLAKAAVLLCMLLQTLTGAVDNAPRGQQPGTPPSPPEPGPPLVKPPKSVCELNKLPIQSPEAVPPNSSLSCSDSDGKVASSCTAACNPGYKPEAQGDMTWVCDSSNTQWKQEPPVNLKCIPEANNAAGSPGVGNNGRCDMRNLPIQLPEAVPPNSSLYCINSDGKVASSCTAACKPGYKLENEVNMKWSCDNAKWNPEAPHVTLKCIIASPEPPKNSTRPPEVDNGIKPNTTLNTSLCDVNTLPAPPLDSTRECTDSDGKVASSCTAVCNPGFKPDTGGNMTWVCNTSNAQWNQPANLSCIIDTPVNPDPGMVAGAVIGSVVGAALLAAAALWLIRRKGGSAGSSLPVSSTHSAYSAKDSAVVQVAGHNQYSSHAGISPANGSYATAGTAAAGTPYGLATAANNNWNPWGQQQQPTNAAGAAPAVATTAGVAAVSHSHARDDGGGLVAGFTLDQLTKAMGNVTVKVNRFVGANLRPTEGTGVARGWLLHGLEAARPNINSRYRDSGRLTEDWARNTIWQWLKTSVWATNNPVVAAVQKQAATPSSAAVAQAARDLLAAIKRDRNHPAFKPAVQNLSQELVQLISRHAGSAGQHVGSQCGPAVVQVVEAALLLQLQALGTSGSLHIYVPGRDTEASKCSVTYEDLGVSNPFQSCVLCSKPGVYDVQGVLNRDQNGTVIAAQAAKYGLAV